MSSMVARRLKRLPAVQETWVRFLDREDPLEKKMATHSSILAWRIPWTREPGGLHRSLVGYSPRGCKESDTTERLHFYFQSFQHQKDISSQKETDIFEIAKMA